MQSRGGFIICSIVSSSSLSLPSLFRKRGGERVKHTERHKAVGIRCQILVFVQNIQYYLFANFYSSFHTLKVNAMLKISSSIASVLANIWPHLHPSRNILAFRGLLIVLSPFWVQTKWLYFWRDKFCSSRNTNLKVFCLFVVKPLILFHLSSFAQLKH